MRKLYFYHAKWCAPCRYTAAHIISGIADACPDQVEFVDVNTRPTFTQRNGVKSLPTVILTEDEKPVKKYVGRDMPKDEIISWLKGENSDTDKSD